MKKALSLSLGLCLAGITACAGTPPQNLGAHNGQLAPCPSSPNCVSSQSQDPQHAIAPLKYTVTQAQAKAELTALIRSLPRTRVVSETQDYVHAEFTSALWRFVDDVEFLFDDAHKAVQVRSASRVGYGDLGVNRKRIETLREKLGWEK